MKKEDKRRKGAPHPSASTSAWDKSCSTASRGEHGLRHTEPTGAAAPQLPAVMKMEKVVTPWKVAK